jgi:hypothetical protein
VATAREQQHRGGHVLGLGTTKSPSRARQGGSKGRAAIKARPKRPTIRTIKSTAARVTVEFKRAVDPGEIEAALVEALAKVRAEQGGDQDAA